MAQVFQIEKTWRQSLGEIGEQDDERGGGKKRKRESEKEKERQNKREEERKRKEQKQLREKEKKTAKKEREKHNEKKKDKSEGHGYKGYVLHNYDMRQSNVSSHSYQNHLGRGKAKYKWKK